MTATRPGGSTGETRSEGSTAADRSGGSTGDTRPAHSTGDVLPAPASLTMPVVCAGCGYQAPDEEAFPIRCPRAVPADDIDHVMTRRLDVARLAWPAGAEANPFVRYRSLFRAWHRARLAGWPDERYVALVERLDAAIAAVDGGGFRTTPFERHGPLSDALGFTAPGGVWVKDETRNVSGSHKARHLAGVMLELQVAEATGAPRQGAEGDAGTSPDGGDADRIAAPRTTARPLAIASCGNAALAAAVVARAAERDLDVYVPTSADPVVLDHLRDLGARVTVCEREPGRPGDPSVERLRAAIADGAIPFTCQGNENGLAIEGGETLAYEMVDGLRERGEAVDRVVVQVGGGALASGVSAGLVHALALGALRRLPRLETVQTEGGWPLRRAFVRVAGDLKALLGWTGDPVDPICPPYAAVLDQVARHRSRYMWPWETEPTSIAHGILDDETYDWLAVVRGMLASGGRPEVVSEALLREANDLAVRTTSIAVDHTGSAGLAGLLALLRRGEVRPDERVAALFTGHRRDDTPPDPHSSHTARRTP